MVIIYGMNSSNIYNNILYKSLFSSRIELDYYFYLTLIVPKCKKGDPDL